MRTVVVAVLLLIAHTCLATECTTVEPERHGSLHLQPVTPTGEVVTNFRVGLFRKSEASPDQQVDIPLDHLPYGNWWVKVEVPGFRFAWRQVTIAQPKTVLRIEMAVSVGCGTVNGVLSGTIHGLRHGKDLWVKAIPLRGEGSREAPVSADGTFSIAGLEISDYILLVNDRDRVLHHQTTSPNSKLRIDLSHTRN